MAVSETTQAGKVGTLVMKVLGPYDFKIKNN